MMLVQNKFLMLLIGLSLLVVSVMSFMNLSTVAIGSDVHALWIIFSIALTLVGLLVSPVLVVMSLGALVKLVLQPTLKYKRKREE